MNRKESGEEVRKYRIAACYTQQALGVALGYPEQSAAGQVRKWEFGAASVPLSRIRKLHELTGIPYEKIIP